MLILGGDYSIVIGIFVGVVKGLENLGVIWYDVYGDLNIVEIFLLGNIYGMLLVVSFGIGYFVFLNIGGYILKIKFENFVIIGVCLLDDGEKELIKEKGIKVYIMYEIDCLGMM